MILGQATARRIKTSPTACHLFGGLAGPIQGSLGRGLAIWQGSSARQARLHRPPNRPRRASDTEASPPTPTNVFVYLWGVRMAVWHCHRLIYRHSTELVYILECCLK